MKKMNEFAIKDEFLLNGEPVKIISGALHYFRVVPEYWRDRLEKLKAMGCNTVETYVPWNVHEPKKGMFNFKGMYNIAEFISIAQELDLWVIIRPSPYICAEWEFGGLPAWLLKDENMRIRCHYEPFLQHVDEYFQVLFEQLVPLQVNYGGPIIMMQVENEYGGYGNDKQYMRAVANMMLEKGCVVPLVTSDGPWHDMLENGSIQELAFPTVNCGSNLKGHFKKLKEFNNGTGPLMVMEFWIGWFDAWGDAEHHTRDEKSAAQELKDVLEVGHVNFYMFHGGTNFGFMSGANYYEKLLPDTTSYDYDAPLTEWGDTTPKYEAFKQVISKTVEIPEVQFSTKISKREYGQVPCKKRVSLFETLDTISEPIYSDYTLPMEKLDQNYGYILYRTNIGKKRKIVDFRLVNANDRAHVYINQELKCTKYDLELPVQESFELTAEENTLDILVENMGRVNYSIKMEEQRKGIKNGVVINGAYQSEWQHYPLPLDNIDQVDFSKEFKEGSAAFHQFQFEVEEIHDTFLDFQGWGKGVAFVNGFNLGRFWKIGPQKKLYIPGPLLKKGLNEIILFETEGIYQDKIYLTDKPGS
ncbi:glycoside hydrolase family 35 protein [Lederbergia ruris]|uniref:glycoside hydrolase family 35 protein n=1 Tax=Lederbergia ruris TaxID=217495 RepID=UPI00399F2740